MNWSPQTDIKAPLLRTMATSLIEHEEVLLALHKNFIPALQCFYYEKILY